MTRWKPAAAATATLLASACASAPTPPAPTPLGDLLGVLTTIEIAVDNQPATMIFDTGGGVTALTPALADGIGCTPWGQLTGFQLSGERLSGVRCNDVALNLGGTSLGRQDVGVIDLSALLPPQAPQIDGLFSLDVLAATPFTLELAAARLTLETPDSLAARIAGMTELPIRLARQAGGASLTVMVAVPTPSGDLWMQLDAGSDAALQVPPSSAVAMGLAPDQQRQDAPLVLTGIDGARISEDVSVRVRDMVIDGNIGIPVLRGWTMTFDLAAQRLWIAPVGAAVAE